MDLNATAAARRAGYSEKTADRIGPELLGKTCVSAAIRKARQQMQRRTEVTQDMVVEKLAEIALGKATDFAVDGYPIVEGAKNKTTSQIRALELLGKHLGMFSDKPQQERQPENGDNLYEAIAKAVEQ